jgi:phospholipid/cholesterol/gamma-HCH transport system substrate-binding protein
MDLHYKQEISVGLLVITGIALFTAGLAWLSGRSVGPSGGVRVPVVFTDISGLQVSNAVQISGKKVGKVDDIVLQEVGRVMVYLSVDPEWRPHADARAMVAQLDLLGSKFINYFPGRSPELLKPGEVITGSSEMGLSEGAVGLTARANEALTAAQSILSQRTADDIHGAMVAATRALDVVTRLGSGPGVMEAREALRTVQSLAAHIDSVVANPAIKKSTDQLDELTTNLKEMTEGLAATTKALSGILQKMESGQGSLGRAVNDTTMYVELRATMKSMRDLLEDIRARPERYIRVKVF